MVTKFKWGYRLINIALLFWVLETIFFLIVLGWHWKAVDPREVICDEIVALVLNLGVVFIALSVFDLMYEYVIPEAEAREEEEKTK